MLIKSCLRKKKSCSLGQWLFTGYEISITTKSFKNSFLFLNLIKILLILNIKSILVSQYANLWVNRKNSMLLFIIYCSYYISKVLKIANRDSYILLQEALDMPRASCVCRDKPKIWSLSNSRLESVRVGTKSITRQR